MRKGKLDYMGHVWHPQFGIGWESYTWQPFGWAQATGINVLCGFITFSFEYKREL